jgi:DNA-binding transcriptional MerR regulator
VSEITVLANLVCHGLTVAVLLAGSAVPLTYDIKDAAERLGVSKRWLQKFLRQHPVDTSGVPFYIPIGNRKRFTERDLERILETNRNAEKDRLLSAPPIHADWPAQDKTYEAFGNKTRPLSDRLARALVQLKK